MTARPLLTPRQREVLALTAAGCEGKDIARRLGLSLKTVRAHSDAMRRRLRARTLAHAVALGYGLLTGEEVAA